MNILTIAKKTGREVKQGTRSTHQLWRTRRLTVTNGSGSGSSGTSWNGGLVIGREESIIENGLYVIVKAIDGVMKELLIENAGEIIERSGNTAFVPRNMSPIRDDYNEGKNQKQGELYVTSKNDREGGSQSDLFIGDSESVTEMLNRVIDTQYIGNGQGQIAEINTVVVRAKRVGEGWGFEREEQEGETIEKEEEESGWEYSASNVMTRSKGGANEYYGGQGENAFAAGPYIKGVEVKKVGTTQSRYIKMRVKDSGSGKWIKIDGAGRIELKEEEGEGSILVLSNERYANVKGIVKGEGEKEIWGVKAVSQREYNDEMQTYPSGANNRWENQIHLLRKENGEYGKKWISVGFDEIPRGKMERGYWLGRVINGEINILSADHGYIEEDSFGRLTWSRVTYLQDSTSSLPNERIDYIEAMNSTIHEVEVGYDEKRGLLIRYVGNKTKWVDVNKDSDNPAEWSIGVCDEAEGRKRAAERKIKKWRKGEGMLCGEWQGIELMNRKVTTVEERVHQWLGCNASGKYTWQSEAQMLVSERGPRIERGVIGEEGGVIQIGEINGQRAVKIELANVYGGRVDSVWEVKEGNLNTQYEQYGQTLGAGGVERIRISIKGANGGWRGVRMNGNNIELASEGTNGDYFIVDKTGTKYTSPLIRRIKSSTGRWLMELNGELLTTADEAEASYFSVEGGIKDGVGGSGVQLMVVEGADRADLPTIEIGAKEVDKYTMFACI